MQYVLIALGVLILSLVFWAVSTYNRFVSLAARVDNSWAQVDVQLKKRFDLLPNLIETVKGYATHEKTVLEDVTKWRGAAMGAKTPADAMQANRQLSHAVVNLYATAEQYPDLKANQSFMALQAQLSEIEGKIAISRQFYNDTTMKYNEYTQKIPSSIIGGVFRFEPRAYFMADIAETAVPQVKL